MGLVETTSLLKKEVITPRLGGRTDILFDLWKIIFQFGKWSRMGCSFPVQKVV
jgi:hypothetical protein